MLSEGSPTPDLVELTRRMFDAPNGRVDELVARLTTHPEADIDEARAAAERLAEERG